MDDMYVSYVCTIVQITKYQTIAYRVDIDGYVFKRQTIRSILHYSGRVSATSTIVQ